MIDQHGVLAILDPLGIVLGAPKTARVSLDENRASYALGTLVFPMPDAATRAEIDLREQDLYVDLRLRRDFGRPWSVAELTALGGGSVAGLTALLAGGPVANITRQLYRAWNAGGVRAAQLRNCYLYVTERTFTDESKELTLQLASLEAVLVGDILAAVAPLDPATTSLRTICGWVLARYGFTLAAGTTDATVAQVDATVWQPGTAANAYLNPMLEAASLRLWADELGTFRLSPRQEDVDGSAAFALITSTDTMTWNPDVAPDAIVVKYSWTDITGGQHVQYDAAGAQPSHAGLLVERPDTVYPGPGAAAGMLARAQGRGRVVEISQVNDLTVSPGMPVNITPPDTVELAGRISAFEWAWPEAEMSITNRGLTDIAPDSWLAGEGTTYTFADVHTHHPTLADNAFTDWSVLA